MANKIYTYAFIKALYDQNRDYFDAFLPIVIQDLSETKYENITNIKNRTQRNFGIDIPLHIIKTVCARGRSKSYLLQESNTSNYKITKEGQDFLNKQEKISDTERRTNSFLESTKSFFSKKGVELSAKQIQDLLFSFINSNIEGLIDFINPKVSPCDPTDRMDKMHSVYLIEYIKEIQHNKPVEYSQFQELVLGSIILSLLSVETSADISDVQSRKFKDIIVFFDTNLIFSLLGFHSEEKNVAAKELLKILSNLGFQLKIFDFTVDEVCRVINSYIQYKNSFPTNIAIDSVYSVLKTKGWGISDVSAFIDSVESDLRKIGITVYVTDVDIKNYESTQGDTLRSKISTNKTNDGRGLSTNHDLAAIDMVREIRKKTVRRIEDAKAFFVTSDLALQRTVLTHLGHHEHGSLSEVILDRILANILWLKNPNLDIPLCTIIASHSRDLLVDRKVWEKFYSILDKLRKEGTFTDSKIEALFYHNNITSLLREYDRNSLDKVNEQFTIDAVEEAVKFTAEKNIERDKDHSSVQSSLFELQTEKEKEEQDHNTKIIEIKKRLRVKAKNKTDIIVFISIVSLTVIFWGIEGLFFFWLQNVVSKNIMDALNVFYNGVGLTIAGSTAWCVWWVFHKKLRTSMEENNYQKFADDINLKEN